MNKIDYVFNINDKWTDDVDYVEHYINELEFSPEDTIEIGERVTVLHKDIFNLRDLIEDMLMKLEMSMLKII